MSSDNKRQIAHYFAVSKSGLEVIADGLKEMTFGEFLVENRIIDRHQLLCALQMQDRVPGARIGECVAALGYLHHAEVEALLCNWQRVSVVLA
ncbi:MAG TPA: hypothetical protein VFU21_20625 [Kofleriaceae bacterium]|jgi:hypothetical protein|nr:hypothetical protein [Kofleriaceae bacterium]